MYFTFTAQADNNLLFTMFTFTVQADNNLPAKKINIGKETNTGLLGLVNPGGCPRVVQERAI